MHGSEAPGFQITAKMVVKLALSPNDVASAADAADSWQLEDVDPTVLNQPCLEVVKKEGVLFMLRSDASASPNRIDTGSEASLDIHTDAYFLPCMNELRQHSMNYGPLPLKRIYWLCGAIRQSFNENPDRAVVIGPCRRLQDITNAALLAGAFFILCQDRALSEVAAMLEPASDCFERYDEDVSVHDALACLDYIKTLGWLDFKADFDAESLPESHSRLNMDEFAHYADRLNGGVHIVVPNRIYMFPETSLEVSDSEWLDVNGTRYFGAAFYAQLLKYLGVNIVLKDGSCTEPLEEVTFEEEIPVEDMDLTDCADMLRKLDRLLAISRHPSSVLAIECSNSVRDNRILCTLLSSLLIRLHAFTANTALAWLRMVLSS